MFERIVNFFKSNNDKIVRHDPEVWEKILGLTSIKNLPTDVLGNIYNYLNYDSAKNLALTSKFFSQINKEFIEEKYQKELNNFAMKAILLSTEASKNYLRKFKISEDSLNKIDKGSIRACALISILTTEKILPEFKILSIFTILNEANGRYLKEEIFSSLKKEFGEDFNKKSLQYFFKNLNLSPRELKQSQNRLLSMIHNEKLFLGDQSYDFYSREICKLPKTLNLQQDIIRNFENKILSVNEKLPDLNIIGRGQLRMR